MKKIFLIALFILFFISLSSCKKDESIMYTDDLPMIIDMKNDDLKILQITDLHLMFGIDDRDQKTFDLIEKLVKHDDYDLVVISGDMTMSPHAPILFSSLIDHMESLKTPWTFIFGNHETDFHDYQDFLNRIKNTTYLYFKVGPEIEEGGVGNFKITFQKEGNPFYHLYFMDSKAERKNDPTIIGEYDYINTHQINWFTNHVSLDTVNHSVFMHIPLQQFDVTEGYIGIYEEKMVYSQGKDEGFFDSSVALGKTDGIFVGHDHLNDFYVYIENILLAYGRATGYNGYGNLERGARTITISQSYELSTNIILASEVNS